GLTVANLWGGEVDAAKGKLRRGWGKRRGRTTAQAPPPPPVPPGPDTAGTGVVAPQGGPGGGGAPAGRTGAQHPRPPAAPQGQALTRDVPYNSNDTGTVNPGMSEREIYELWAAPAAVRRVGQYTYLFYQNGCEYTCGTMDVVTLKDGRVVDAIVRWDGHRYSGESPSS